MMNVIDSECIETNAIYVLGLGHFDRNRFASIRIFFFHESNVFQLAKDDSTVHLSSRLVGPH